MTPQVTETFEIQMFHEGDNEWIDAFRNLETVESARSIVDEYPEDRENLRIVRTTLTREEVK